jgi:hypothetical protein
MPDAGALPIPADAVRVWRGFTEMETSAFYQRLNTVFIPATVQLQIDAGLDAYIPTVTAGLPDKPVEVPDETAILFWDTKQTYQDAFGTLAVRTYTLTHGAVYTEGSHANFPLPFSGELESGQPYHLTAEPADWMHGSVRHLIGGRPEGTSPEEFRRGVGEVLAGADGLAGAIACVDADYLVYWELGDPAGADSDTLAALAEHTGWRHVVTAEPIRLEAGLWDPWPGLEVGAGDSLNMQFERRWERTGRSD